MAEGGSRGSPPGIRGILFKEPFDYERFQGRLTETVRARNADRQRRANEHLTHQQVDVAIRSSSPPVTAIVADTIVRLGDGRRQRAQGKAQARAQADDVSEGVEKRRLASFS
jgi:hypothetical protein